MDLPSMAKQEWIMEQRTGLARERPPQSETGFHEVRGLITPTNPRAMISYDKELDIDNKLHNNFKISRYFK
jgi:hypothetical protein